VGDSSVIIILKTPVNRDKRSYPKTDPPSGLIISMHAKGRMQHRSAVAELQNHARLSKAAVINCSAIGDVRVEPRSSLWVVLR